MGLPEPQAMDTDLERRVRSTTRRLLEILTTLNEPGFAFVKLATTGQRLSVLVAGLTSHLNRVETERSPEYTIVPSHMLLADGRIPWWRHDVQAKYPSFVGALIPSCKHPSAPKEQPDGPTWWKTLNSGALQHPGLMTNNISTPPTPKEQRIGDPTLWAEMQKPDLTVLYPSVIDSIRGHDMPVGLTPPTPSAAPPKVRTYRAFMHYVAKKHPMPAWKKKFARYVAGYWRGPVGMQWRAGDLPDYTAGETDAEYEVSGGKKTAPAPECIPPVPVSCPVDYPTTDDSPPIPTGPKTYRPTYAPPVPPRAIPHPFNKVLHYAGSVVQSDDNRVPAADENGLPYVMPPLPNTTGWSEKSFRSILESEQYSQYIHLHNITPRLARKQFAASWDCVKPSCMGVPMCVDSVFRAMRLTQEYCGYQGYSDATSLKHLTPLIISGQPFALTTYDAGVIFDAILRSRDYSSHRGLRKFLCSLNFARAMMVRDTPQYEAYRTFLCCMIAKLGWCVMSRPSLWDGVIDHAKRIHQQRIHLLTKTDITNHTIDGFVSNPDKWVPNSNNILRWMYGSFQINVAMPAMNRSMLRMLIGLRPTAEDAKNIQGLFYAAILAILTGQVDLPDGLADDTTLVNDDPSAAPPVVPLVEPDDNIVVDQPTEQKLDDDPTPSVASELSDWETDFTGCPIPAVK